MSDLFEQRNHNTTQKRKPIASGKSKIPVKVTKKSSFKEENFWDEYGNIINCSEEQPKPSTKDIIKSPKHNTISVKRKNIAEESNEWEESEFLKAQNKEEPKTITKKELNSLIQRNNNVYRNREEKKRENKARFATKSFTNEKSKDIIKRKNLVEKSIFNVPMKKEDKYEEECKERNVCLTPNRLFYEQMIREEEKMNKIINLITKSEKESMKECTFTPQKATDPRRDERLARNALKRLKATKAEAKIKNDEIVKSPPSSIPTTRKTNKNIKEITEYMALFKDNDINKRQKSKLTVKI